MKRFMKVFPSFEKGIRELADLSYSACQALEWETGKLPLTEKDAAKSLMMNVLNDRPTGNGYGWGECAIEISAYGVSYWTRSGLNFGWETVLGASQSDCFEGEYVFFIAHPDADESSAAPEDSTLREACEEFGWQEKDELTFHLAGAMKFL